MADINQFQRSKDRINEILRPLMHKKNDDPETAAYIKTLEIAIDTLDLKMAEYQQSLKTNKGRGSYDFSF